MEVSISSSSLLFSASMLVACSELDRFVRVGNVFSFVGLRFVLMLIIFRFSFLFAGRLLVDTSSL